MTEERCRGKRADRKGKEVDKKKRKEEKKKSRTEQKKERENERKKETNGRTIMISPLRHCVAIQMATDARGQSGSRLTRTP